MSLVEEKVTEGRNIKKIFVSMPMHDKTEEQIKKQYDQSVEWIHKHVSENADIVSTVFDPVGPEGCGRLWYLGRAIKKLDGCDAVYFYPGWDIAKGCRIEYTVAKEYGLTTFTP